MTTLRQRLDLAESQLKNKPPAPDSQMTKEIHRALDAFDAGFTCPADVSPEI
jgi:hypothetical protein